MSSSSKAVSLRDLQIQCKELHLSTVGTKAELTKRLKDYAAKNRSASSLSAANEDEADICEAILIAQSRVQGGEEEMKEDATDALGQALEEEELHVEHVAEKVVVGNRRGLNMATRLSDVERQTEEISSLRERIMVLETNNASLEDRVRNLTTSLDAYKLLRHRFISTFKRDKLDNATDADLRLIGKGNSWAHGGDAVVDAQLYEGPQGRRDFKAFERLYGFAPETVLRINHQPTIDLINKHAKIAASKHEVGSERFYALFAQFVTLFKEYGQGYEETYLLGNPTEVTRAYWAFLNCINDEVTREEPVEAGD